jgi:hypothetical protein
MSLRLQLLRFLRVPAAPSAPSGDEDVRIFRAAPNFFRYRMLHWAVKNCGAVIGLLIGIGMLRSVPGWLGGRIELGPITLSESLLSALFLLLEGGAIVGFIVQALWSLALLRLDFEQRWYIVSDRSLRIREGLVRLHEKTMTFANIQHVTIRQGPLQRLLRIADLQVRTAGGGGGSSSEEDGPKKDDLHVAYFRGVADAERIRDAIRERLRKHRDAGLGDPDDHGAAPDVRVLASLPAYHIAGSLPRETAVAGAMALTAAARALADEARTLRAELSGALRAAR